MEKLFLNFWGVKVRVVANDNSFINFAKKYFQGFEVPELEGESVIDLSFNFQKYYNFKVDRRPAPFDEFLGEKAGMKNGSYEFQFNEVDAAIKFDNDRWSGNVNFKKNLFKHFANLLFFRGRDTQSHYYRFVTRLIIQNLVFMKLKQDQKMEVLSGAAISINGQAYAFIGLPGAGKSTLIDKLLEINPEAIVLTGNYVIISADQVYFYTEGAGDNCLQGYPLKEVHIISRGNGAAIEGIASKQALSQIVAVNNYTAELPMHGPFTAYVLHDTDFEFMLNNDTLQKILETAPAYRSRIDKGANEFIKLFSQKR